MERYFLLLKELTRAASFKIPSHVRTSYKTSKEPRVISQRGGEGHLSSSCITSGTPSSSHRNIPSSVPRYREGLVCLFIGRNLILLGYFPFEIWVDLTDWFSSNLSYFWRFCRDSWLILSYFDSRFEFIHWTIGNVFKLLILFEF